MTIARKTYEKTPISTTGSMQASSIPADLEAFQAVVAQFEDLEAQGLIDITTKHRESQTGKHYVDLVMFKRLR